MTKPRSPSEKANVLVRLQNKIEHLHDTPTQLDVEAYVVSAEQRRVMAPGPADLPEQLLIREDADGVEVALYIDPTVVAHLERRDPWDRLDGENLESFCIALEGVSHFLMLAWCNENDRSVSALELELQAEVDKFVGAWIILAGQGQRLEQTAAPLSRQLFDAYALRDGLDGDEADRYHTATDAARRYCRGLVKRHGRHQKIGEIEQDLRGYYRLPLADKLRAA